MQTIIALCVCMCVWISYQFIRIDAGDDSPLESPKDEHGHGHNDANLPWFVLCGVSVYTQTHISAYTMSTVLSNQSFPLWCQSCTLLLAPLQANELWNDP